MAKYIICDKCGKFIEFIPEIDYVSGTKFVKFKCPECGYEKTSSTNHIHYGEDGKK